MKFQILQGQYSDKAADGSRRIYKGSNEDIIETGIDLCERFNVKGYAPKFAVADETKEAKCTQGSVAVLGPPAAKVEDPTLRETLEGLHHKKLNKYAEDNEYDIEGLTSNEEKINSIIAQADLR